MSPMRESWTGRTKLLAAASLAGAVGFLLAMDVGLREARLVTKALPMVCLLLWLWPARGRYAEASPHMKPSASRKTGWR